jgi:hypothetical protein
MNPANKGNARPHGQVRQSQVITTFGPGALMDLPNYAAIVGGLEFWQGTDRQIFEERLVSKLQTILDVPGLKLYAPPVDSGDPQAPKTGIAVWMFPEWFVAQREIEGPGQVRSRPLIHRETLVKNKYIGSDRKKHPVVPIRFVQACLNGHISDIDWYGFVHDYKADCRRQLFVDERGTGGDLSDITIRCECGKSRPLIVAAQNPKSALGFCKGWRPWLGNNSREQCGGGGDSGAQINRLLIRSASNAYFPQVLSVISIPEANARVRKALDEVWEDFLQYAESLSDLAKERKRAKVSAALEGLSDAIVYAEIERRRGGGAELTKSIKNAEIESLLSNPDEMGEDILDGDFFARVLPMDGGGSGALAKVDRVVLVHRLREVVAQVGFTRFEAAMNEVDGELSLGVRRAPLAREISWLPAIENRGEGILIAFKKEAIKDWLMRPEVQKRGIQLMQGFQGWQQSHPGSKNNFPGLPYIMLHSLSHLLITAVSLECGYSASSIRERIYVGDEGYGILLHTGTPDSEGTLGGLVHVGRSIEKHLRNALELGRLCANDPVCAQHNPQDAHEERYLMGAACHGCLLIAETSCERFNQYLDRSLVVSNVGSLGTEFFSDSDL